MPVIIVIGLTLVNRKTIANKEPDCNPIYRFEITFDKR